MGNLSFRYAVKPKSGHIINTLRYNYESLTKYGLAYQRNAALSDASIFDSPVGITKIAAGLSDLRSLFITKSTSFEPWISKDADFARYRNGIVPYDNITPVKHNKEDISDAIRNPESISFHQDYHMNFYRETYASGNEYLTTNDFELLFGYSGKTIISELPTYFAKSEDMIGNDCGTIFAKSNGMNHTEVRDDIFIYDEININLPDDAIASSDSNHMNILSDKFGSMNENQGEDYGFQRITVPRIGQNEYENLYAKTPIPQFSILKDIFGWHTDADVGIIYQTTAIKATSTANSNEIENAARKNDKGFLEDSVRIPQRELAVNYPYQSISSRIDRYTNKLENLFSIRENKVANKFDIDLCTKPMPKSNIYDILIGNAGGKTGSIYEIPIGDSDSKIAYDMDGMFFNVKSNGKVGYFFNPDTFSIQEIKYAIYTEDLHGKQNEILGFIEYRYDIFGNKDKGMNGFIFDSIDAGIIYKYLDIYSMSSLLRDRNSAVVYDSNDNASRDLSHIFTEKTFIPAKHIKNSDKNSNVNNADNGIFVYKDDLVLSNIQKSMFTLKDNMSIMNNYSGIGLSDFPKAMFFKDEFKAALKRVNDIYLNRNDYFVYRLTVDIDTLKEINFIYRDFHDLHYENSGYFIHRLPYDLILHQEDSHVFRKLYDIEIMAKGIWAHAHEKIKIYTHSSFEDAIFVFRTVRYAQTANMIIPFSKINNKGTVEHINGIYRKIKPNGWLIKQDMWASVIQKPVQVDDDQPWIDRTLVKAYIDYQNHWLTKTKIKSMISNSLLGADKENRKICIFRDEWVSKERISNEIYEPPTTGIKIPKDICLLKDEWMDKNIIRQIHSFKIFDGDWLEKILNLNYYSYGLMADRSDRRGMTLFKDESAHKDIQEMVIDFGSSITKDPSIRMWIDEYVFTERNLKDFDIYKSLKWLEKTRHKLGLHPNDMGNWAWVYETPDPIEPIYGIDELLLPENDTKYENFKEIIFDKERMRPRNPVKVIDDTTFIAKYPIVHPSKDHFADLGVDYDASAYKWENYYGIKTEIMYVCFLKYYRIWEVKMFEFSTMTMQQAVNQMLEYMYAWMIDYFPLEELEEAFRVLRLIRWYGETAIIQNSQYLISYEYGILESKLTSGTCLIPNNLDTNDTMFVDASMGVIRNNPAYIGNGPAYVEFYIDNKKNTTFTFSLSNTVGSVNIYINDELVDQRPFTVRNLTYPLNATGETNVVRIEKPAGHNLNDIFYIGNIKVPDCAFKDLSIEFDPKLRAGNKPLDSVAKKMVKFAQLHENRDEVYDMIFKKNLGINEVYKKLLEYWELHHANKTKGKRLTIKKS